MLKKMLMRLFAGISLMVLSGQLWAAPVTIDTPQGKLIGETTGPGETINTFKGIPYAAPPTGQRRTSSSPA